MHSTRLSIGFISSSYANTWIAKLRDNLQGLPFRFVQREEKKVSRAHPNIILVAMGYESPKYHRQPAVKLTDM